MKSVVHSKQKALNLLPLNIFSTEHQGQHWVKCLMVLLGGDALFFVGGTDRYVLFSTSLLYTCNLLYVHITQNTGLLQLSLCFLIVTLIRAELQRERVTFTRLSTHAPYLTRKMTQAFTSIDILVNHQEPCISLLLDKQTSHVIWWSTVAQFGVA